MKSAKLSLTIAVAVAFLLLGGLVLGLTFAGAPAEAQTVDSLPRTITVVGDGKVTIKPDIATTNIGVEIMASTVKEASTEAATTMEAIIDALKANGVAAKDIQTSGYNVWMERPYQEIGVEESTQATIYRVSNTLNVIVRDLDNLGTVLDVAMEAGANNIYGVNFSLADQGELASEARADAVADALAKATELAGLNNVEVGQVVSISEVVGGGGYYASNFSKLASFEGMGGGTPVSPGELELTVQLQITYQIN